MKLYGREKSIKLAKKEYQLYKDDFDLELLLKLTRTTYEKAKQKAYAEYDKFHAARINRQKTEFDELEEWAKEAEPAIAAFHLEEPYDMDWTNYHRRGIALAQQLRERLSTDFDLWYDAPFEDKSGTIKHPILIL